MSQALDRINQIGKLGSLTVDRHIVIFMDPQLKPYVAEELFFLLGEADSSERSVLLDLLFSESKNRTKANAVPRKLLLIDKDHTLIRPKSGQTFVKNDDPTDQEIIPGVLEALNSYGDHEIVIISNQGGVAAGYKTLHTAIEEMQFCLNLFPQIHRGYFCPDEGKECFLCHGEDVIKYTHPQDCSFSFRKPSIGMIHLAVAHKLSPRQTQPDEAEILLSNVLFVGDRDDDQQTAIAANIPFLWAEEWRSGGARAAQ